jgi:hypothetical protein
MTGLALPERVRVRGVAAGFWRGAALLAVSRSLAASFFAWRYRMPFAGST